MNTVTVHDQQYEYYSWEMLGNSIFELSKKICEQNKEFDRVIALAKGGLTFSRSLVDYLNIGHLSSIQIEFYTDVNQHAKTPVVTQSIPTSIRNERVLIFDDVVDKGETLTFAVDYIKYHGVKEFSTAALIAKPWSTYTVDFAAHQSTAWVIFPNEARESIQLLSNTWRKKGDTDVQIRQQLLEIGFPEPEVEFFLAMQ